jgi:hypothetical protein
MTRRQLLRLGAAVAVAPSLPVPAMADWRFSNGYTVRMGDWDVTPGAFSNRLDDWTPGHQLSLDALVMAAATAHMPRSYWCAMADRIQDLTGVVLTSEIT